MLQFIIGRAATGKTYTAIDIAKSCVQKGENPIILVPEQFSFECERRVLSTLGDSLSQKVNVLSFSRIYDEVNRVTGGVCTKPLTDSDRLILMKKAIKNVSDKLLLFGKYSNSLGFAKNMCETVAEFKTNAVFYEDIIAVAEKMEDGMLKNKLIDTAEIMLSYDGVVTEKFIDPSDELKLLYDKLENYRFFESQTVIIDSFDGFTGQQFRIIDRIISQCKDIFVTLNMSCLDTREYSAFSNIKKLKERLTEMAKNHSVKLEKNIELNESRYENKGISCLEKYLYNGEKISERLEGITVCEAETVYDEAEFVARNIRKIVRESGARYKDFLVCVRDISMYSSALKSAMKKNDIPCFFDSRTPLSATPMAATVLAAADLLRGITSEKIFKFYKSGLNTFTSEELGTLENYVFVWNIDGKMWFDEWDMNPKGFVQGEVKQKEYLKTINEYRERAILPILNMRKSSCKTAKEIVLSIVNLLDSLGIKESCLEIYKSYCDSEDKAFADVIRQSYDSVIGVFDSIVATLGNEEISAKEFFEALNTAISLENIGVTPQSLDEVTFGAADRIRPMRPKYVFLMGVNQNVFPKAASSSGVFSLSDRTTLSNLGLNIPDRVLYDSVNEEYLVYANSCCATNNVFFSYASTLKDGTKGECSAFLADVCDSFEITAVKEPETLCDDNLPETVESAFSDFCKKYNSDGFTAENLSGAIRESGEKSEKIDNILSSSMRPEFKISPETAQRLSNGKVRMSPSKFDDFSRCAFMYFGKDLLGIKSLQKSEFDVLQRGTIIHYVLERIIKVHKKNIANLTIDEISNEVDKYTDEYLSSVVGFSSIEEPRFKFIVYSIKRSLKAVACHISDEFKNSDFEPVECELGIGIKDSEIPPLSVDIDNMGKLELVGVIDRLDSYNGYVRIIDYKSGSRNFKIPDILFGQNMQMLIYLYAVCNSEKYGGVPAGILYMPASRDDEKSDSVDKMNGLINDEDDVVLAMDRTKSGRFIPKKNGKTINSFASSEEFSEIFNYIEKRLKNAGKSIFEGKIGANPVDGIDSPACKYCEFMGICRIEDKDIEKVSSMPKDDVINEIKGWEA